MMQVMRVRLDFNGNQIGQPEIIEILPELPDVNISKLARIYARMIQNELNTIKEPIIIQKSERKSC